jgi:hypothetical protein
MGRTELFFNKANKFPAVSASSPSPDSITSSPSPDSITSSVPRTSENNIIPTPNTPSNQKIVTQGRSQGSNPPPTRQNTTTNLAVDCNANRNERSCSPN